MVCICFHNGLYDGLYTVCMVCICFPSVWQGMSCICFPNASQGMVGICVANHFYDSLYVVRMVPTAAAILLILWQISEVFYDICVDLEFVFKGPPA